jgi:hypothetical protein
MSRILRLGIPLAMGAAAVAAALVVTQPWDGGGESAASQPEAQVYGVCNVSVRSAPDGVKVAPLSWPAPKGQENTPANESLYLALWIPSPSDAPRYTINPQTGLYSDVTSLVAIDAATGQVASEHYRTAEEEAALKGVVSTLKVGPWEPQGPAWPRTDTPPRNEPIEPLGPFDAKVKYRQTEAGSGLTVGETHGDTFIRVSAYTCKSVVDIDGRTGEIIREQVAPDEQAMFDRFLNRLQKP